MSDLSTLKKSYTSKRALQQHEMETAARQIAHDAMFTLVYTMRYAERDSDRILAASKILDRAYGKPKEDPKSDNRTLFINISGESAQRFQLKRYLDKPQETVIIEDNADITTEGE